jgi:hypothetical protein
MRNLGMLVLLLVLAASIGAAYVIYQHMETKTVALQAEALWQPRDDGASCASVPLTVDARTMGLWAVPAGENATITATVAVEGSTDLDLGLTVYSPNNRMVYRSAERFHEESFEIAAEVRGDYRLELDNRHSTFTKKDVLVSVCVG